MLSFPVDPPFRVEATQCNDAIQCRAKLLCDPDRTRVLWQYKAGQTFEAGLAECPSARCAGCFRGKPATPGRAGKRVAQLRLGPVGRMQHAGEADEASISDTLDREEPIAAQRPLAERGFHHRPRLLAAARVIAAIT